MLEIVGWTYYNDHFKEASNTREEIDALIKNIKENGYKFSGDEHENKDCCTPVLSNGCIMHFSWREWGGIMAKAYNLEGDFAYALWYMKDAAPKESVYPKEYIDYSKIEKRKDINIYLSKEDEDKLSKAWNEYEIPFYLYPIYEDDDLYRNDRILIHFQNGNVKELNIVDDVYIFILDNIDSETIEKSNFKGLSSEEIFAIFNKEKKAIGYASISVENI